MNALTAGAMGAMILAVASRVPLGHTGRPVVAPPAVAAAYLMVSLGALVRIVGPLAWPTHALSLLLLSGMISIKNYPNHLFFIASNIFGS